MKINIANTLFFLLLFSFRFVNAQDGSFDLSFDPLAGFNDTVRAISLQSDGKIIVGGDFTTFNGVSRNRIARLNSDGSLDQSFNPGNGFNGNVYTLVVLSNDEIAVGGAFTEYDGVNQAHITKLTTNGTIESFFGAFSGCDGPVRSIQLLGNDQLLVGGDFTQAMGWIRPKLVVMNGNGTVDGFFDPLSGFDAEVCTTDTLSDGAMIIGGAFTSYNQAINRNKIAMLQNDGSGGLDINFDPGTGFNGTVHTVVATMDDKVIVGGDFTTYDGVPANGIIRLNRNGSVDQSFVSGTGFNDKVLTLCLRPDGKIVVGGSFSSYNGTAKNGIIRLNTDGLIDTTFVVGSGFNGEVKTSFMENNGNIVVAGGFTSYNDTPRNRIMKMVNCSSSHYQMVYTCGPYYSEGDVFSASGVYTQILTNSGGCDSILVTNLTIYNASSGTINATACDTFILNGEMYTSDGTYTQTIPNAMGCDSVITLHLIITGITPLQSTVYSTPSDPNNCLGQLAIQTTGNPDFTADIDGNTPFTYSGYHLETNLCPGVHTLTVTDNCGNMNTSTFVIPIDTNYVFNNPFIDSIAIDSLGQTIENCDIYYGGIDTAFIDSIWATGNTVNVIWNIVDSNGSNLDTTTYELNNGNGVYWLQLSVFCPTRAAGDYFATTEAVYFEDGSVTIAGLDEPELFTVNVFPNPSNRWITVAVDVSDALLTVVDAQGRLVFPGIPMNEQTTVDLTQVANGVYLFRLETDRGSVVKRVVKQ